MVARSHRGSASVRRLGRLYSLATFVLGWWAIPRGPIWTIRALGTNLREGTGTDVAELLETIGGSGTAVVGVFA